MKVIRRAEIGSMHFLVRMELKASYIFKKDKTNMRVNENVSTYKLQEE